MNIDFKDPAIKEIISEAVTALVQLLKNKAAPSLARKILMGMLKNSYKTAICVAVLNAALPLAVAAVKSIGN